MLKMKGNEKREQGKQKKGEQFSASKHTDPCSLNSSH
jgi:hypothetical protein